MATNLVLTGNPRVKQRRAWGTVALGLAVFASGCAGGPDVRDEVVGMLQDLAGGYKHASADEIIAHYSDDFAIEDPTNQAFRTVSVVDATHITRSWSSGTRNDFKELLRAELARFEKIEKAKFVLDDLREADDGYEIDTWFNLFGRKPGGVRHHEESWHRMRIEKRDGQWRIHEHRVLRRQEIEGRVAHFTDRAKEVGLDHVHASHAEVGDNTPIIPGNFSGSGASAGDIDGDGYLDLLVGDGERSRLYRNRGDGTFEDISDSVFGGRKLGLVRGAYLVDYDDDGKLDMFFTRVKEPLVLMRNLGELRFVDVSDAVAMIEPAQAESAVFGDLDGDGDLDIYVVRYGDWDETSWAYPLYNAEDGVAAAALRNNGDGTFTEVENEALSPPGWGLAAALGDYDGDGDLDLYLVNDFGVNHLVRNDGDWQFTDVSEEAGVPDQGFGMSAAFADHDNDGDLDIYVANMHSSARWVFEAPNFPLPFVADFFMLRGFVKEEMRKMTRGNSLFANAGDGTFEQVAAAQGVERNGWAWGANWFDYDNDGDLDIYCPNGFITGKDPADC